MKVNNEKTKTMIISRQRKKHEIKRNGNKIKQVDRYRYLGTIIQGDGKLDDKIGRTARLYKHAKQKIL